MSNEKENPIMIAREMATSLEGMLNISNLDAAFEKIAKEQALTANTSMRDISIIDAVSVAILIVGVIAYIQQIKAGFTMQNMSRDQIIERLILRISDVKDLTPDAKERLIRDLIDRMMPLE